MLLFSVRIVIVRCIFWNVYDLVREFGNGIVGFIDFSRGAFFYVRQGRSNRWLPTPAGPGTATTINQTVLHTFLHRRLCNDIFYFIRTRMRMCVCVRVRVRVRVVNVDETFLSRPSSE